MKSFREREGDRLTQLTDRGLLLQCAGIMLNRWDGSIGKSFWVRDDNEKWGYMTRKYSHIGDQVLQPGKHLDESSQTRALALLTKASLDQLFASPKSQGAFTGVLVSYYEHDEEVDVKCRGCRIHLTNGCYRLKRERYATYKGLRSTFATAGVGMSRNNPKMTGS